MTDYKRSKLREAVLAEIGGDASPVIQSHIDAYLDAVEMAAEMRDRAKEVADNPKKINMYLRYSAEMRHQEKAARDALAFLGIKGGDQTDHRRKPIPSL